MNTAQVTPVPAIVYEQFEKVRNIGATNMLDMNGVIEQAQRSKLDDLVNYLAKIHYMENRSERSRAYMAFLEGFRR